MSDTESATVHGEGFNVTYNSDIDVDSVSGSITETKLIFTRVIDIERP